MKLIKGAPPNALRHPNETKTASQAPATTCRILCNAISQAENLVTDGPSVPTSVRKSVSFGRGYFCHFQGLWVGFCGWRLVVLWSVPRLTRWFLSVR